jgi:hypothetical protein
MPLFACGGKRGLKKLFILTVILSQPAGRLGTKDLFNNMHVE